MCVTFLFPTQKLYLFPNVEKAEVECRKNPELQLSEKIFRSVHKMMGCTQQNYHSFSCKIWFLFLSREEIIHEPVVSDF